MSMKRRKHRPKRAWASLSCTLGLLLQTGIPLALTQVVMISPAMAQAAIQDGYRLMNQGLVNQAIAVFEQAVRDYPQSVEARLGLAMAYQRQGRIDDAFQAYNRVLELDPNNRMALLSLGILGGYRIEWQDRGIEALNQLLELNPNDLEARSQRALLYGYQGRFGPAIADYEIVLAANPTPEVILGAAQVYAYNGDYSLSLELFERYQATGGVITGSAATAYAVALRETGNPATAISILERELGQTQELNGVTIRQRAELSVNYAANGQLEEAIAVLTPLRGRRDSRMILARSLIAIGRYSGDDAYTDQAIPLFQEILSQERDYLTVSIGREIADVLSGFPQIEARLYALEVYRQLLQQQPNDRSFQISEAILEREFGLISNASLRDRLEAALQPLPTDRSQQRVIATALVRLDSPDPSLLPYYEFLAEAGVNEPRLYYRIAQMQVQLGEYAAAEASLERYISTTDDEYAALLSELLRAEADRRQGNLEASASRYEAVIASNPDDAEIINSALQGLAGIRQAQGRLPEAVAIYDELIARNSQDAAKPLGRASLAYQAGLISEAEAEAVLNQWTTTRPASDTPPELFSLVAALPPSPQRESLYVSLLETNPDDIGIQVRYVQVLAARDPAAAEAYVDQLIASDPDNPNVYFVQGQLAQEQGDLRQAGRAYQTLLERDPNNVDALSALGGVRFQQRQYDTAARLYNEVLALEPNNRVAQVALVDLQVVNGRRLAALRQLEQLQQQQTPPDPSLAVQQQRIEEGFLQQRGFQPPWERY
ncbi:tetratricopeptide repeat protein [Leptolyngbya sp. NK1-12]